MDPPKVTSSGDVVLDAGSRHRLFMERRKHRGERWGRNAEPIYRRINGRKLFGLNREEGGVGLRSANAMQWHTRDSAHVFVSIDDSRVVVVLVYVMPKAMQVSGTCVIVPIFTLAEMIV